MDTNELEIFSEEIRRETVRQDGWRKNGWKGKILVALMFGVHRDMTRIALERKCDDGGLYFFGIGKKKGRDNFSESGDNRKRAKNGRGERQKKYWHVLEDYMHS